MILISEMATWDTDPFPHYVQDDILDPVFAQELQNEILNIPSEEWDRYENPFEHITG